MSPKMKIKYLSEQKKYVEQLSEKGGAGFGFISLGNLMQSMRSAKYKDTSKALFELIDNSIEAQAERIIIAVKTVPAKIKNKRSHVGEIAIIDTGYGMEPNMIRAGLNYGGTHRYNQRNGIGRFGMGFPSACGYLSPNYSVYSKLENELMWKVGVSIQDVITASYDGIDVEVPEAAKHKLPNWIGNIKYTNKAGEEVDVHSLNHCTVVHIIEPDALDSGYYLPNAFINNMRKEIGITYRDFLSDSKISLIEYVNKENKYGDLKDVSPLDPLFLREDCLFYSVKENDKHAQAPKGGIMKIKDKYGKACNVSVRYSYLPAGFRQNKGALNRVVASRSKIMNRHRGAMILKRNGRQMSVVPSLHFPNPDNNLVLVNNDANWVIEVNFPASLDEVFNVSYDKQGARPSPEVWEAFENFGMPGFINDSRSRYKEEAALRYDRLKKDNSPTTVERVIESIKKVDAAPVLNTELETALEEKKEERVKIVLEEQGIDKGAQNDDIKDEIDRIIKQVNREVEVEGIKYKFGAASRNEGPFYWSDVDGVKVTTKINTAHPFFNVFYAEASKETKDCIRILLYSLVKADVESPQDNRRWYASQRSKWSQTLGLALENYSNDNPIDMPIELEPPVDLEDESEVSDIA